MKAFFDAPLLLRQVATSEPLAGFEEAEVLTGVLNAFEMVHTILRQDRGPRAEGAYDRIAPFMQPLTRRRLFEAARLRVRHHDRGLSYADAAGYATARELGAIFVTTDRGFRGLPGVKIVMV